MPRHSLTRPDVAVIGGGAVTVCAAMELAAGASALLIERDPDLG